MIHSLIFCVLLATIDYKILQSQGSSSKATFELFSGDNHSSITSMFIHESFHECSMENGCNFIARDTANEVYKKYASEAQLPLVKTNFVIFKKQKLGPLKDCKEIMDIGEKKNGIYEISIVAGKTLKVFCDMATDGGGWTAFQRRVDASTNFKRGWNEYRQGFGNLTTNFWLGLDAIHALTSASDVSLRVELVNSNGERAYAKYSNFNVGAENTKYKLGVSGFSGNAGDSLADNNGRMFETMDMYGYCSIHRGGAWWYSQCGSSNLNGVHPHAKRAYMTQQMMWYSWQNLIGGITFSELKIRRN